MKQMDTDVNAHLVTKYQNVQMWTTAQGILVRMVELVLMGLYHSLVTALKTTEDQLVS